MNYLNYFSQCDKREQSYRSAKAKNLFKLFGVFGFVLILFYLYYFGKGIVYNMQLKYLQEIKNDPGFIAQYSVSNEVANLVDEANKDYDVIMELHNASDVLNTANEKLFNVINDCIDENSSIQRFNVSGKYISLDCITNEMSSITKIESSLRNTEIFSSIQINVIDNENQNDESEIQEHKFNCSLVLEGAVNK